MNPLRRKLVETIAAQQAELGPLPVTIHVLRPAPHAQPDPCTWPGCECAQACEAPNQARLEKDR